jgi:hypothetical protein
MQIGITFSQNYLVIYADLLIFALENNAETILKRSLFVFGGKNKQKK